MLMCVQNFSLIDKVFSELSTYHPSMPIYCLNSIGLPTRKMGVVQFLFNESSLLIKLYLHIKFQANILSASEITRWGQTDRQKDRPTDRLTNQHTNIVE